MKTTFLIVALCAALATPPAYAQDTDPTPETTAKTNVFGVRAGYTSWNGVHQMHWGAHLKLGEVFPNVQLTPNVEFGFGGHATVIIVNGDLTYDFTELVTDPWHVYSGGSLSFNTFNPPGSNVQTDLGLSAIVGVERTLDNGNQGFGELRFGIMDSPSFKLTFGYTLF